MTAVFVTGTDTGVGKTMASAWLCQHWEADYWKPIQSGLEDATDSALVAQLSGSHPHPEAYRLKASMSPNQSAELEGIELSLSSFKLPKAERLVVEGAGGVLVPINAKHTMLDLMVHLNLPVIVVARSGLGTLNHTGLTVNALRQAGLDLIAVILNGAPHEMNRRDIQRFFNVPVLAEIPLIDQVTQQSLGDIKPSAGFIEMLDEL